VSSAVEILHKNAVLIQSYVGFIKAGTVNLACNFIRKLRSVKLLVPG